MEFTPRNIAYLFFRLRRLLVIALLLPAGSLLATGSFVGPEFVLTQPQNFATIMLAWTVLTAAHTLKYPNGWADTLSLSIATSIMICFSPYFLSWASTGPSQGPLRDAIHLILEIGVGLGLPIFVLYTLTLTLLTQLAHPKTRKTRRNTATAHSHHSAEALRGAFWIAPDKNTGTHLTGAPDQNGVFSVTHSAEVIDEQDFSLKTQGFQYHAKILERSQTSQTTQFFLDADGQITSSSVSIEQITPTASGARYTLEEIHDHFDAYTALAFWITDHQGDSLTEKLDALDNAEPRALRRLPYNSLITSIARRMPGQATKQTQDPHQ